jgi:hypothetical protein
LQGESPSTHVTFFSLVAICLSNHKVQPSQSEGCREWMDAMIYYTCGSVSQLRGLELCWFLLWSLVGAIVISAQCHWIKRRTLRVEPSRIHHTKGSRFSHPRTEPPIADSVCLG